MAVLTGTSGSFAFGTGYAGHCHSWTVEIAQDVFEDTALGDSWRTKVVGILDWSGSFDCYMDDASMSDSILNLGFGEAAAAATFTYAAGGTLTGSIILTGATANSNTEGANTITFTFQGTGALTLT
jgi:predicted secreted protein